MSAIYNIEKLDDTNYESWAVQMKSVLVCQDYWSITSGKSVKPEGAENSEALLTWLRKDEQATATITLCVKSSQILHIKNVNSSKAAWEALSRVHKPKGPASKVTLYKSLINMRMMENENARDYVCRFCTAADKLLEAGIEVQQEMLVLMVLGSLPKSYENLVVALESRDELPSLDVVKVKLFEDSARRIEDIGTTSAENGVFLAHDKRRNNFSKNNYTERNNRVSNFQNLKCYCCGRKGHISSQCRSKGGGKNIHKGDNNSAALASIGNNLFSTMGEILNKYAWCVDSGATSHLCCHRELFVEFKEYNETIILVGQNVLHATGIGVVRTKFHNLDVTLGDVLYVPGIQCNFISVAKVIDNGYTVLCGKKSAVMLNTREKIKITAKKIGDLYIINSTSSGLFFVDKRVQDGMIWHRRYGHLNFESLRKLSDKNMINDMQVKLENNTNCTVCMRGKCVQKPFKSSDNRADDILGLVHTDLCGPMNRESIGGAKYVLTFIDDKSRYVFVYFLKSKSLVYEKFKEFKAMVELQTSKRIKILRSDNGTEFVNGEFDTYLKDNGILRQLTIPYTPQQNGTAERFNRTLIEMARCMLIDSNMSEGLWAEAVATAAYLRNRAPTRALNDTTPFEAWFGRKPSVAHIRIFGAKVIALDKKLKGKFKPRGKEYELVGYSTVSKGYRLYDKTIRKIIVSKDVYIIEPDINISEEMNVKMIKDPNNVEKQDKIPCKEIEASENNMITLEVSNEQNETNSQNNTETDQNIFAEEDEDEDDNTEATRRAPGRPTLVRSGNRGRPRKRYNTVNLIVTEENPQSVKEAMSSRYKNEWVKAMKVEYDALLKNKTWEVTELPKNQKIVGNKWVFTVKRDEHGHVERFKARLVAKGCSQKYGINYTETFSPVARYETIRIVFAIAVERNLYVHQMDVSTAYLNSELNENVYMSQPEGFVDEDRLNCVLKLNRALYGLKQSGREWNIKLDGILKKIGFEQCESERCVYTRHAENNLNIIAVYVDDLLIASSSKSELNEIKIAIKNELEVVDKGEVKHFLSFEVKRQGETGAISLSQKSHIRKLMTEHGMEQCRPVATPLDPGYQVFCKNNDCKIVDPTLYQSLIGSLMYIAVCTRPDILYSVCKLSQRNTNPHQEHLTAAKRVLRYLCSTFDKEIQYEKTGRDIECYVDADWGSDIEDRKSYTGYIFKLANAVISYESKKQSAVALSSTEAEYMALSSAVKEATYLKKLLKEMKLQCPKPMIINGDNLSAQNLVKNPVYHSRSKHIEIKYHHVRNVYTSGDIELKSCPTNEMIADILTKNLPRVSHEKFTQMMGIN